AGAAPADGEAGRHLAGPPGGERGDRARLDLVLDGAPLALERGPELGPGLEALVDDEVERGAGRRAGDADGDVVGVAGVDPGGLVDELDRATGLPAERPAVGRRRRAAVRRPRACRRR